MTHQQWSDLPVSFPSSSTSAGSNIPVKKDNYRELIYFLRDIIIIIIIVLLFRSYIASPFQISGSSMETAYHDGELIIVDKWSYADFAFFRVGDPNRGDVVILRPHVDNSREYFIKRVIGLPGDHLKIAGGAVSIRRPGDRVFTELDESYLSAENKGNTYLPLEEEKVFTIPEGQYFVMGDNRRNSTDSRVCFRSCETGKQSNFVKRSDIVGKVFFDFGSFNVIAKPFGWVYGPRFLDTMRSWKYPELEGARIRPQS